MTTTTSRLTLNKMVHCPFYFVFFFGLNVFIVIGTIVFLKISNHRKKNTNKNNNTTLQQQSKPITTTTQSISSSSSSSQQLLFLFYKDTILFVWKYVCIYVLARFGDSIQLSYLYALLDDYGYTFNHIIVFYIIHLLVSLYVVVTTTTTTTKQQQQQRSNSIVFCCFIGCAIGCFLRHFKAYSILLFGQILYGISISYLFPLLESWLINTHYVYYCTHYLDNNDTKQQQQQQQESNNNQMNNYYNKNNNNNNYYYSVHLDQFICILQQYNYLITILGGLISNYFAEKHYMLPIRDIYYLFPSYLYPTNYAHFIYIAGYISPMDISMICFLIGAFWSFVFIHRREKKNHNNNNSMIGTVHAATTTNTCTDNNNNIKTQENISLLKKNHNNNNNHDSTGPDFILLSGIIHSLFEATMYIFMFIWTPIMMYKGTSVLLFGIIYSTLIASCMVGSTLFHSITMIFVMPLPTTTTTTTTIMDDDDNNNNNNNNNNNSNDKKMTIKTLLQIEKINIFVLLLSTISMFIAVRSSDYDKTIKYIAMNVYMITAGMYFSSKSYRNTNTSTTTTITMMRIMEHSHHNNNTKSSSERNKNNRYRIFINCVVIVYLLFLQHGNQNPNSAFALNCMLLMIASILQYHYYKQKLLQQDINFE